MKINQKGSKKEFSNLVGYIGNAPNSIVVVNV